MIKKIQQRTEKKAGLCSEWALIIIGKLFRSPVPAIRKQPLGQQPSLSPSSSLCDPLLGPASGVGLHG